LGPFQPRAKQAKADARADREAARRAAREARRPKPKPLPAGSQTPIGRDVGAQSPVSQSFAPSQTPLPTGSGTNVGSQGFLGASFEGLKTGLGRLGDFVFGTGEPLRTAEGTPITAGVAPAVGLGKGAIATAAKAAKASTAAAGTASKVLADSAKLGEKIITTSGLTGTQVSNAAGGVLKSSIITEKIALGAGKFQTNTYYAGKQASYLSRMSKVVKNPYVAFGIVMSAVGFAATTLFQASWGKETQGNSARTLTFTQSVVRDNLKENPNDPRWRALAAEVTQTMATTEEIAAGVPFYGVYKAGQAELRNSALRLEAINLEIADILAEADKNQSFATDPFTQEPELSFSEEREKSDLEARERQLGFREEDDAAFDARQREQRERELQQQEEDAAFFQEQAELRRQAELAEREEDRIFFEEQRAKREREFQERRKSQLGFGLIR
jgi:hypothetical protein|tara:strand:+ start:2291 stop:3619 length:1329 start_codon:yes stop_codon:yes gene_type:complete